MKTIGLLGGMSWESTQIYYKLLNEGINSRLGGFHSAKIILYSVDFHQMQKFQKEGKWEEIGCILAQHAKSLERAGADFVLICTNTMHKVIDTIQAAISIPIIHIAEATSDALHVAKCKRSILLGTRFTMKEDFNKKILENKGIGIVTPSDLDMIEIDRIIFEELVHGKILEDSKKKYKNIIETLSKGDKEIDSVILGCTEIGLLIKENDTSLKLFDTTPMHVEKALKIALKN